MSINPALKHGIRMALCGVLLGLSAPGFNAWWLAWLALIPALYWTQSEPSLKRLFWGGFLLGFFFQGTYCLWFFDLHPLTWLGFDELSSRLVTLAGWLLIGAEGGLLTGLLFLAYRRMENLRWRLIGFPLLWVFMFYLLNLTPMALPWGLLEYTQAPLASMRWLAATITGSGLTALIILHNTFWAECLRKWQGKWSVKQLALGSLILPLLLFGWQHLPEPKQVSAQHWPMPIVIVQANLPIEVIRSGRLTPAIIEPAYVEPVENLQIPAGSLVIYPEEGVVPGWIQTQYPERNPMLRRLIRLAQQKQIYIAVGVSSVDAQLQQYNSILLLSPNQPPQFYHKRRLVPFGEFTPYGFNEPLTRLLASLHIDYSTPYNAGQEGTVLNAGNIKLGGLICFELIDSTPFMNGYAMRYRQEGVNLLINTSNLGWFHQNPLMEAQFLAIGQLRAAESGLPLAIASNTGISAIIASSGKILIQTRPNHLFPHKTQVIFYNGNTDTAQP
jgi:apolipoprotein N-acyltransferase